MTWWRKVLAAERAFGARSLTSCHAVATSMAFAPQEHREGPEPSFTVSLHLPNLFPGSEARSESLKQKEARGGGQDGRIE